MTTGSKLLAKAFKHINSNKLKGLYGETDYGKKVITINKKAHKKTTHPSWVKKNPDGTANLLDTIVHERMHANHPKMHEKTVRKKTSIVINKMGPKQKKKLYSKFN